MPKQHIITHVNKSVDTSEHKIKTQKAKDNSINIHLNTSCTQVENKYWKIRPKDHLILLISATENPAVSAAIFAYTGTQPVAQSMLGD